jgi:hypothetical protein
MVPTLDEVTEWARLRDIPVEAVIAWRDLERPVSKWTIRDGVSVPQWGLKGA